MFQTKHNMTSRNTKQILSNLYGLMMEINYHRAEEEVLKELQEKPDPQLDKYLIKIKQLNTKLNGIANKNRFQKALEYIKEIKQKGLEELKDSLTFEDQQKLIPLFRKFEALNDEDEKEILEDSELLHYLEVLKDKLEDDDNP